MVLDRRKDRLCRSEKVTKSVVNESTLPSIFLLFFGDIEGQFLFSAPRAFPVP